MSSVNDTSPARPPFVKQLLVLWGMSLIGIALVLPYALTLQGKVLEQTVERVHLPLWQLMAISLLQSSVTFLALIAAGLWAARKVGFGTPLIGAALTHSPPPPRTAQTLAVSFVVGAGFGLLILALDKWVFSSSPSVAALIAAGHSGETQAAAWKGFLASFYGGFDEEVLMRLGLVSLFTLALRWAFGSTAGFWIANVVAAVIFGAAHLPTAAALAPVTSAVVTRTIVLNALVGIAAGVQYRRYGLEWAMALHFGADIVLHVFAA